MNKVTKYIYLVVFFAFAGCEYVQSVTEDETKNPLLIKRYYDNGTIKAIIPIDSTQKRHGLVKSYFTNGELKTEVEYNHGAKEKAIQYYENGNKFMEIYYKDGLKDSIRTKYWNNGNVQSYLPYRRDFAGRGLREFNKNGREYTKYPKLKVKQIDNLNTTGQYIVEIFFDKYPSKGTYYVGKLKDGFLSYELEEIEKVNGKGRIVYRPMPGTFKMEKMYFVGRYKTTYGNPHLDETSVNLAIDF